MQLERPLNLEQETDVDYAARLRRESDVIAQARAEIAAGAVIDDDEFETWADLVERDPEALLPASGRTLIAR
jgi:hypothetical protein